jgi:hypothetical protein
MSKAAIKLEMKQCAKDLHSWTPGSLCFYCGFQFSVCMGFPSLWTHSCAFSRALFLLFVYLVWLQCDCFCFIALYLTLLYIKKRNAWTKPWPLNWKKKKKTTKLSLIPDGRGKLVLSKNDLGYFRIGSWIVDQHKVSIVLMCVCVCVWVCFIWLKFLFFMCGFLSLSWFGGGFCNYI